MCVRRIGAELDGRTFDKHVDGLIRRNAANSSSSATPPVTLC